MRKTITALVLAGIPFVAGASEQEEAAAMAAVAAILKDPDSANFRNVKTVLGGGFVCGEVNAKNSYGGYVGFRKFYWLVEPPEGHKGGALVPPDVEPPGAKPDDPFYGVYEALCRDEGTRVTPTSE